MQLIFHKASERKPKQGVRVLLKIKDENCPVVGYWGCGTFDICDVNFRDVDGRIEGYFEQTDIAEWAYVEDGYENNAPVYATQDPKYHIQNNRLVNSSTLEPIPMDEPVFLFRAKDTKAVFGLTSYASACNDTDHWRAVKKRISDFESYKKLHADQMKEPDSNYLRQGSMRVHLNKPVLIDKLFKNSDIVSCNKRGINGRWYIAKPHMTTSLRSRCKHAWLVITGKAIAIQYAEDVIIRKP